MTNPTTTTTASTSIVTISYPDLLSNDPCLVSQIGAAFGPDGLGILAVTNVPDVCQKRQALLPLAALLPGACNEECILPPHYSTGWSHGKELLGDKPDISKGSFYANPLVNDICAVDASYIALAREHPDWYEPNVWPSSIQLEEPFMSLGSLIVRVGRLLAKACDDYCRMHNVELGLEQTLTRSWNVKGRLLHYFDTSESTAQDSKEIHETEESLWCGWHNDHGTTIEGTE
jgi:hypothetical protein